MALTTVKSDQIQASVALAGSPTTTTQSASDNSTKVATTAYVETAVANLVLDNKFVKEGISPPEFLGDHFNFVNDYLTERDVIYKVSKR